MIFITRFEIVIEHLAPLDVEKLGQLLSTNSKQVFLKKELKGNIQRTIINVIDYNRMKS